jgi:hypothetical protein
MIAAVPGDEKAQKRIANVKSGLERAVIRLDQLRKAEAAAIITRKREIHDPRLEDIRLVEGDCNIDDASKMRRILALRSFAIQYDETQKRSKVEPSKLTELYDRAYDESKKRTGKKGAKDFDSKALSCGLKHMVFEKIWNDSLLRRGRLGNYDSISFLVGLNMDSFRRLGYADMMAAVNLTWDMEISITPSKRQPLYVYLQEAAGWFHSLQGLYNRE